MYNRYNRGNMIITKAVTYICNVAYMCKGGWSGGKFPHLRGASPPQRFSTSLIRDVTQKKIFSLPYSPLSEKIFLPALFPPLKNFFCSLPYSPTWKFDFFPALFPPHQKLFGQFPAHITPHFPTHIPYLRNQNSYLPPIFSISPPTSPSWIFFVVPYAYPPPENFRKM